MTIKEISDNFVFRIPNRLEELEDEENFPEYYTVDKNLIQHPNELATRIQEAYNCYKSKGPDFILENFDYFYYVIKWRKNIESDVCKDAWILLNRALTSLSSELKNFLNENFQLDKRRIYQNKLQMIVYPFVLLSEMYEVEDVKVNNVGDAMDFVQGNNRMRKQKNQSKNKSSRIYEDTKNQSISMLLQIFTLRLKRLFDPPHLIQNFINISTRWIYKIVENSATARLRNSKYFSNMCEIIAIALERYQHGVSYCMKIIEILQNRESSATILSDLVAHNIKHLPNMFIINDIITQIKLIDISILSRDSSGPRAISSFLVELGAKCPNEMFKNISDLLDFLEQDSYLLRNATLEIISIIIIEKFRSPTIVKDVHIKNKLLDKLEDHIHDITSYTRSRVLNLWCNLSKSNAIPIDRLPVITDLIVGRLQDKSCLVRKNAIHFLSLMLEENPFNMMSKKDMMKTLKKTEEIYVKNKQQLLEMLEKHTNNTSGDSEDLQTDEASGDSSISHNNDDDDTGDQPLEENEPTTKYAKKRKSEEYTDLVCKKYKIDQKTQNLVNIWNKLEKPLGSFWETNKSEMKNKLYENFSFPLDKSLEDDLQKGLEHCRNLTIEQRFEEAFMTLFQLKNLYPNEKIFELKKSDYNNESEEDGQRFDEDDENDLQTNGTPTDHDSKNYDNLFIQALTNFAKPIIKLPYELTLLKLIFLQPLINLGNLNIEPEESNEHQQELLDILNRETFDRFINKNEQLEVLIRRLQLAIHVTESISKSIPAVCTLLNSRNVTDVQEAIRFFTHAFKMDIENSIDGVKKMLVLIFTKELTVRNALLEAFAEMYLNYHSNPNVPVESRDSKSYHYMEIKELCNMILNLDQGELVCAEALIKELHKAKKFNQIHLQVLWERYAMKHPNLTEEDSRASLIILGMLASAQPTLIQNENNLQNIISISFDMRPHDYRLVADTCEVLLKAFQMPQTELMENFFKLPPDHLLFRRISDILVDSITNVENKYFLRMSANIIKVIYFLAEKPDSIISNLIKQSYESILAKIGILNENNDGMTGESNYLTSLGSQSSEVGNSMIIVGRVDDVVMSHFISMLGDVAVNLLINLDLHLMKELKIRQFIKEKDKQTKKKKPRKSLKNNRNSNNSTMSISNLGEDDDDEMNDIIGANNNEDPYLENITKVCNEVILYEKGILSKFTSLIERIASDYDGSRFSYCLRQSSSLTLAKFMILSMKYTRQNRTLLAGILEKSKDADIRSNAIISFGDLLVRFPNEIEHFTGKIFGCLLDQDFQVKSNALKVLTRLILADMIKPKGHISKIAQLITDEDQFISSSAKLFFVELGKKNNVYIYNYLPDIISNLSGPNGMEEKKFQEMIKFLFELLEKTRNAESLVTKLCQRFTATSHERTWRDVSFCLSQLQYNDRAIINLIANFQCFADTLYCDTVFDNIMDIINNVKKAGLTKIEVKTSLDEMESRMKQIRAKGTKENINPTNDNDNPENNINGNDGEDEDDNCNDTIVNEESE